MRSWVRLAALLLLQLTGIAWAVELQINQKEATRQICSGMYSRTSWGGSVDPFILVKFLKPEDVPEGEDPLVSLVIFEWRDHSFIGHEEDQGETPDVLPKMHYLCDNAAVESSWCTDADLGKFIVSANATKITTAAVSLRDPGAPINYPVTRTGYYCVGSYGYSAEKYTAIVEFRNAFGELPAAQIPKLPFYAAITLVYAFLAIGWGILYWMNRQDILAVQNYITAIVVFLVVEMFMTWLFYDYQNRHGLNAGAKALLVVVSILSAARNSFSFFLLLIVCMGYGVVKPTLGKTMTYVRYLALTHFIFGVVYAIASLAVTPENAGPLVLLVVLPLAATLTGFYVWTLNSLNLTMKDLMERKQTIKAAMYRKLWWCILLSIIVIFVFFFVNSWTFAGRGNDDFVPNHWQSRWFILDGWLNLVYFCDVAFIAYIWRPTANNRRFAMSDEIAQDDDGFEIASIRDSMDMDDDLEVGNANGNKPPPYDAHRGNRRDVSPLPAPVPTKPTPLPRESLDGETIFAVGEEDKFSDDEDDVAESKALTGKKD